MTTLKNWKFGFVPPLQYSEENVVYFLRFFAKAKVGENCCFIDDNPPTCLMLFGEFYGHPSVADGKFTNSSLVRNIRKTSSKQFEVTTISGSKYAVMLEDEGSLDKYPYNRYEQIFSDSDSPLRLIKQGDWTALIFDTFNDDRDLSKNLGDQGWLTICCS